MKVSRIKIENFRQFRDFDIDLTYPKGHPKAGQPLDKVCIIGQNGTGKTTLLNLIDDFYLDSLSSIPPFNEFFLPNIINVNDNDFTISIEYLTDNKVLGKTDRTRKIKSVEATSPLLIKKDGLEEIRDLFSYAYTKSQFNPSKMLFFPFGINSRYFLDHKKDSSKTNIWTQGLERYYYAFPESMDAFEKHAFSEIEKYQKLNADYKLHLVKLLESGEKIDILKKIEKWQKQNKNPLLDVAAYLDKLLNKFHLRTKTILDSVDEINSIQLESMVSNETIPFKDLSSGTRQILNIARPLYHLLVKDSIVLMDEPETSLYPDLQREIVSYYTTLREDLKDSVQYFFATHSPIVASSFDPWEIIDLEFDESGFVKRHLYYEGEENHVDNYILHPKYLRWDSILRRVFDIKQSGNPEREKKILELAKLQSKLEYWKEQGLLENPTAEVQEGIRTYKQLSKMMDWKTNDNVNL